MKVEEKRKAFNAEGRRDAEGAEKRKQRKKKSREEKDLTQRTQRKSTLRLRSGQAEGTEKSGPPQKAGPTRLRKAVCWAT